MRETVLQISTLLGEKYYKIPHGSGLDIYVCPKNVSTTFVSVAVNYGAADRQFRLAGEKEYTAIPDGTAHFLEHKMFEMEDGADAFDYFAETGADANAFTSSLTTCYLFSCTEEFEESLAILLDMVAHPHFTDESVEREKEIIAQEIKMSEDQPSDALYYGLMQLLYQKNNQRIRVAGTVESIADITAEPIGLIIGFYYLARKLIAEKLF